MRIDRTDFGAVTVLRLEGDLDEHGVEELRSAFYDCMVEGRIKVVANLREVRFISYMALGVLVERLRKLRACTGDLKLVGLSLYAQRLFRMAAVMSLFECFESESQAVGVFQEAA